MGGPKLGVLLRGRPLIEYPLQAMRSALPEVVVIAKPGVELPQLPGVELWLEPAEPQHPLLGIVEALALAGGRAILSCPADLPFVTPGLIARLAATPPDGAPAVIAGHRAGDRPHLQPLLGCYQPRAAELLAVAARRAQAPVRQAVAEIHPKVVDVADPDELYNVNCPDDLLLASAMLGNSQASSAGGSQGEPPDHGYPKVKS
jgi:molybdopterin-guanine dinucleotide biosynthesis protein A